MIVPKLTKDAHNLTFGDLCKNGSDEIISDVCKDLPEDFQNVTLIEFCTPSPCIDEKSMDSPSKLPNLDCGLCKYVGISSPDEQSATSSESPLELSSPDEQAGADEKLAKIIEELGFRKVDGQGKENGVENLQEKVDHANEINAEFFNANDKVSWY